MAKPGLLPPNSTAMSNPRWLLIHPTYGNKQED